MRLKFPLLILFFLQFAIASHAQKTTFEITIVQDGVTITPGLTNDISLKKTPFKIVVKLNNLDGVYLYASFKDSIYKIANGEKIPGFTELPFMALAENPFNPDEELLLSNEGWAYWFYDPKLDWHRFDKNVYIEGENVTGTKTVRQFYDISDTEFPVTEVKGPLYLFFVSVKHDKKQIPTEELQRHKIKITWK